MRVAEVPDRDPSLPARVSTAAAGPRTASTSCRCARSRSARRIYGVLEKQFRGYYDEANRKQGKTGENLLRILESPAGQRRLPRRLRQVPRHGPPAGPARPHPVNGQQGRHPVVPGERATTSSRSGESSLELTPFVVARAEAGERTVPAWLEVIPNRMRILVHSLPARQVIDTPGPGAADRRALLEVSTHDPGAADRRRPRAHHLATASYSGRPREGETTCSSHSAPP